MAMLPDVHLGVPVIYSTFIQEEELLENARDVHRSVMREYAASE